MQGSARGLIYAVSSAGKPFWERAGVADKVDLRIAPALETLDELLAVRPFVCLRVQYFNCRRAGSADEVELGGAYTLEMLMELLL